MRRMRSQEKKRGGDHARHRGWRVQRPAVGKILTDVKIAGVQGAEPAKGARLRWGEAGVGGGEPVPGGWRRDSSAHESHLDGGYRVGDYLQKDGN